MVKGLKIKSEENVWKLDTALLTRVRLVTTDQKFLTIMTNGTAIHCLRYTIGPLLQLADIWLSRSAKLDTADDASFVRH